MTGAGPGRREALAAARVYLIWTPTSAAGDPFEAAARALSGGRVGMVQLRVKDADDGALRDAGRRLQELCRQHGALFVVNDDVETARRLGADGVHLGEEDASPEAARAALGPDVVIGLSTHGPAEVLAARARPVDYVGLGPCYATGSKALTRAPGGPALVRAAAHLMRCVFPIGGITPARVPQLAAAGARRVAVGAGILGAEDPRQAAEAIHQALAQVP